MKNSAQMDLLYCLRRNGPNTARCGLFFCHLEQEAVHHSQSRTHPTPGTDARRQRTTPSDHLSRRSARTPQRLRPAAHCLQPHRSTVPRMAPNHRGRRTLYNTIGQLCEALGLHKRVHLHGLQHNVAPYYTQSDLFVLSSRYEGFPNALCEAMAHGLPVIAANCPSGPAEIIQNGENGLLVPVEDPKALAVVLDHLLGDNALRSELSIKAQNVLDRFSAKQVMSQWEKLLHIT
ncbi:hypothetical protein DSUL_60114 [Desulfovibrionales bacterium]